MHLRTALAIACTLALPFAPLGASAESWPEGEASATPGLPLDDISGAIRRHMNTLEPCMRLSLPESRILDDRAQISLTIGKDGRIVDSSISHRGIYQLSTCVVQAVRGWSNSPNWRLPELFGVDQVEVVFRYRFRSTPDQRSTLKRRYQRELGVFCSELEKAVQAAEKQQSTFRRSDPADQALTNALNVSQLSEAVRALLSTIESAQPAQRQAPFDAFVNAGDLDVQCQGWRGYGELVAKGQ